MSSVLVISTSLRAKSNSDILTERQRVWSKALMTQDMKSNISA